MAIKLSKGGVKSKFDISLRRKIGAELLEGNLTASEIKRKYGVGGSGSVKKWALDYQKEQEELLSSSVMKADTPQEITSSATIELEKELQKAKAKIAVLETMIDLAEEQFKIEIRKKSGTKPSIE